MPAGQLLVPTTSDDPPAPASAAPDPASARSVWCSSAPEANDAKDAEAEDAAAAATPAVVGTKHPLLLGE